MLITFQQAMERVDAGRKPSILLGNGFSRAWRDNIFNYANLFEQADFGTRQVEIKAVFDRLGTYDFEAVMRALDSAQTVLEAYGGNEALITRIQADRELLKEALIAVIASTHPDIPSEVTGEQFRSARAFLWKFDQVFTVNYDLLFYWARNMIDLPPEGENTDDGFRANCRWQGYASNQVAHFLHGGLHIYDTGTFILKHTFAREGTRIIDQVRDNLERGRFPLFVSEPNAKKKLVRIKHNPYLNYCYRALGDLGGSIFILGHSMDENDKHIFDQVKMSRVDKVFVSIHGDENSDGNARTKANAIAFLEGHGVTVTFFDAASASVWG